ncbi:hypothetical protein SteCoe_32582 [Stentor coeruleus]|uniref:Uncharacterized protein n=1 Tax=Stentor coeruleus TaxID=5963 RepID=A0A1R2AYN5_9CILI|nr:hypothetical protein SteCoe_32582 [Stentor coeruleus]
MLRCSTWRCKEVPSSQCTNCLNKLLCPKCLSLHTDEHLINGTTSIFQPIQDEILNSISENTKFHRSQGQSKYFFIKSPDFSIIVYNQLNNQQEGILKGHKGLVRSIVVTNDDKYAISGSEDYTIRVWNLLDKREEEEFDSDYQIIIPGGNDKPKHLEIPEFRQQSILRGHTDYVNSLAITNDNQFVISVSDDNTVKMWNFLEERIETVFEGHTGSVKSVAISNDDHFAVTGSCDHNIIVWNLIEKRQQSVMLDHECSIEKVSIFLDNKCCSLSSSEMIVWDLEGASQILKTTVYYRFLAFNKNETIWVTSLFGFPDDEVQVWNLVKKTKVVVSGCKKSASSAAVFNNNCLLALGSSNGSVILWNITENKQEDELKGHTEEVSCIALTSDNGLLISGSKDYTLRVWNLSEKKEEAIFQGHTDSVTSVVITNNDKLAISGSYDMTIRIWNLQEKRQETVLQGSKNWIYCMDLTKDNRFLVSGSYHEDIIRWDLSENQLESFFIGHVKSVCSIGVSFDNRYLISESNDLVVRVWDIQTKAVKAIITMPDNMRFKGVFASKIENIIYISSGLGISVYNIDKKTLEHGVFFDKTLDDYYYEHPSIGECILPKVIFND